MPTPLKYIVGFLVPVVIMLGLLSFGNCQWGKFFYMWQTYILKNGNPDYPRYDPNPRFMPDNFTGIWRDWDESGQLTYQGEIKNGILNGNYKKLVGNKYDEIINIDKSLVLYNEYAIDWKLEHKVYYVLGKEVGIENFYDKSGNVIKKIYWDDKGKSKTIYQPSASPPIDLRSQYTDEIAKWEKKYKELE